MHFMFGFLCGVAMNNIALGILFGVFFHVCFAED